MNKFPELVPKICPNEYLLIDVIAVSASHSIYNKIPHIFSCYFIVLFRLLEDKLVSQIRSDQISRSVVSDSLRPHESQHARPPCPSPTPGVHSDSCPSSQ